MIKSLLQPPTGPAWISSHVQAAHPSSVLEFSDDAIAKLGV
jgi:hypothetical protein